MRILRRYGMLLLLLFLLAFGSTLTMKMAVGVGAFDAMNRTLSLVSGVHVGTIIALVQLFFVLGQFLLLRKEASWGLLFQIPLAVVIGQFINFFFYGVFADLTVSSYFMRLVIFIGATAFISVVLSGVMVLNLVGLPVENLAMVIALKTKRSFGHIRQLVDVFCIAVSLLLTLAFAAPFTVREGTVIGALMIGPLMNFFMPKVEILFVKWRLIEKNPLVP